MLQNLHLKNFTIIDELDLDFHSGMTVLTGETGAGKSIIIDAIELALGARADTKVIREGCDQTEICVTFAIHPHIKSWLIAKALQADEECLLRRVISKEGRSRNFINGSPVTLQLLNELGSLLVNIHGQHEHQDLLKKERQLQLVDAYAKNSEYLATLQDITQQFRRLQKRYDEISTLNKDRDQRREFLKYQLQEFEKLNLAANEIEQLEKDHKQLANAEHLLQQCQLALSVIEDSEHNISSQLHAALQAIATIRTIDPHIETSCTLLNDALIQTDEAANEIRYYLNKVDLNPERLQEIDARLVLIHDLARKHRVSASQLYVFAHELRAELKSLENSDEELTSLRLQLDTLQKQYLATASELTHHRKQAAAKLVTLITKDIQSLGMQSARFDIHISSHESLVPHPLGLERIEFLVAANPGQSLQPLNKVASGGELSRLSLAIQVNLIQVLQTATLIFDEVDTGIGGGIAEVVGKLLKKLGEKSQVFCITHLPQVAALAHHHLQVRKECVNNHTSTTVSVLTPEQRVSEIARMLGGTTITKKTKEHAKEMLDM